MNFTEAVAEVVDTVKRPDKISLIRREVNAAIVFFCSDSDFPRDYAEQAVNLDPQEYTQAFALTDLERFRKFKYVRRAPGKFLTPVADSDLTKGCEFVDRYYQVGSNINVALAALSPKLDVGYYKYPAMLTDDAPLHWLLDMQPYMVIDRACAAVFRGIGDEKSMQVHAGEARLSYLAFRKDILGAT